jgi:hypothetical protein
VPTHVLATPADVWFIVYPRGCYRATRDWRGRGFMLNSEHVTPPADTEIAARWGTGYIHAKRISFPVASEFTFEEDKTLLDHLATQKLTNLIFRRKNTPPSCTHALRTGPRPSPSAEGPSRHGTQSQPSIPTHFSPPKTIISTLST